MKGTTYESGIGLNNEHTALLVQSLLEEKEDPQPKMEQWRKACCLSAPNFVSLAREESVCFIFYDIETGGLGKNANILQFVFAKAVFTEVTPDSPKESQLSFHILPTKRIDASASKVNGLHVSYKIGEKTLVDREGRVLPTVTPAVAAQKIVDYLNSESALNNRQILLVAHNGSVFDRPRFIQFLKNNNALDNLLSKEQIYFGDSLPPCRKTFKVIYLQKTFAMCISCYSKKHLKPMMLWQMCLHYSVGFVCSPFIQMCSDVYAKMFTEHMTRVRCGLC